MKKLLLFSVLLITNGLNAQIGIGTDTPSANAVLDVNSTDKGLMLPRLNNTSLVSNPTAGLMIYDKSTSAPAYHDGMKWNSMTMPSVSMTDSLSYQFTAKGTYSYLNTAKPLPILSINTTGEFAFSYDGTGTVSMSSINMSPISFIKLTDINSIGFLTLFTNQSNGTGIVMEVNVYKKGSRFPYFTYKFSNIIVTKVSFEASPGGSGNIESYLIFPQIYGWKDNVSGFSVAYDVKLMRTTTY